MADLSDQEDLSVRRITDEVKQRVLSWAKWIVGGFALLAALAGIRAYGDYQDALKRINEDLNKRVETEVRQEVAKAVASYEKFTAKMIDTIVEAEGRQRDLKKSIEGIQKQVATAEEDLQRFRKRLNELEQQAEGDYKSYSTQLTLTVSRSAGSGDPKELQSEFAKNVDAFARELGLNFNVKIIFKAQKEPGILGLYNERTEEYEVNPESIHYPGLAKSVALLGYLYSRHYKKCLRTFDSEFWIAFRDGIQDYIVEGTPLVPNNKVLRSLKAIERLSNKEQARKLAIRLLDGYQCNWKHEDFRTNVTKINADHRLLSPDILKAALDSVS